MMYDLSYHLCRLHTVSGSVTPAENRGLYANKHPAFEREFWPDENYPERFLSLSLARTSVIHRQPTIVPAAAPTQPISTTVAFIYTNPFRVPRHPSWQLLRFKHSASR